MCCYWVWCIDLPIGIQVDRLDQRNCLTRHGCFRVLVVPLHADLEGSPPQLAQLLSGHAKGWRSLPREDPLNQHSSLHVRDLLSMHNRHNIIVRPDL